MFARFDPSLQSDAELVSAALRGETQALGLLFQRYRAHLHATALSLVGCGGEAEDAIHDTFLTALTRLPELRDPAAVAGWLQSILRNRCLMELRRRRPQAGPEETERVFRDLPDETRVESLIESRDLRDWVWAALARLSDMHRATVMLRYFGGFSQRSSAFPWERCAVGFRTPRSSSPTCCSPAPACPIGTTRSWSPSAERVSPSRCRPFSVAASDAMSPNSSPTSSCCVPAESRSMGAAR